MSSFLPLISIIQEAVCQTVRSHEHSAISLRCPKWVVEIDEIDKTKGFVISNFTVHQAWHQTAPCCFRFHGFSNALIGKISVIFPTAVTFPPWSQAHNLSSKVGSMGLVVKSLWIGSSSKNLQHFSPMNDRAITRDVEFFRQTFENFAPNSIIHPKPKCSSWAAI